MPLIKSFDPSTDVNTNTDTINIPSHGFGSLDGVIYRNGGGSSVGGLVHNTKYYVIVIDNNNIKLGTTEVLARNSTAVNLISTGAGTVHTLEFTTIFPKETSVHNIFQKVRLTGGGLSADGETITAETVDDTLNIVGGAGVSFTSINDDSKSFTLQATQYDFEVPVGTTNLRLFSDSGDDQSIILTPARGIAITRIGSQEVEFESFGVTETDTLQSISERGNITNNKLIMDNLLVAKIESTPGIDGVVNYTTTGTTGTAIALTGNGTLDNELLFSPDYATSTETAKDVYVNFQSPAAQGTLSYTAVYTSESTLTTGSVILQRNDGGGWVTIDNVSGTTVDQSYEINGNYAEILSSTVDYRIIFSWTGSSDIVTYRIRVNFEVENVPGTEIILTDTDAEVLTLGTLGGSVVIRGNVTLADDISTDGIRIFNNNITSINSDDNIVLEPSGVGGIELRTETMYNTETTFNLFPDTVTELNIGWRDYPGDSTIPDANLNNTNIRTNLHVDGYLDIKNNGNEVAEITTSTMETVHVFTGASTIVIGNGTTDINLGNIDVNGNIIDTNDSTGITVTPILTTQSDLVVENDLNVAHKITATDLELSANALITQNLTVSGNTAITGNTTITGDLLAGTSSFNLLQNATTINIGATTGTTTLGHNLVTVGDIQIQGGDLTTDQTTFNLLNTTATTVNAFGDATTINFGSLIFTGNTLTTDDSSGITFTPAVTFESDITVGNDITVPTVVVTSGLSSPKATITELTTSSITNSGTFGTGSLGVTNNATIGNDLNVGGDAVITGNLTVQGTQTILNTSTLDVEDLNITVAKGAADATAANGAGLTIDGANATLTYDNTTDRFITNKGLTVTALTASNGIDSTAIGDNTRSSGKFTTLDADNTVTLSPANTSVTISPSGTGTVVINPNTASSIDNVVIGGTTAVAGTFTDLASTGWLTTAGVTEQIDTKTSATGTVAHDLDVATVFYHSSISGDFVTNFTNVPTTNNRTVSVALVLEQGAIGRDVTGVEVNGSSVTVKWLGGITHTGTANEVEILSFTIVRVNSTYQVLGSISIFG